MLCGLPLITYAPRGREGGGVKPALHFYCVLHAKRGEGVQIACKIAYVINGRPLLMQKFGKTIFSLYFTFNVKKNVTMI